MSEKLRSDAWPLIHINTIQTLTGPSTKADKSAEADVQTLSGMSKTIAVKETSLLHRDFRSETSLK
jgi:hypothetical protein